MKIKPLNDRVVIEPLEQDDITPSGIHLPEIAKEKPMQGYVKAIGPGYLGENGARTEMSVKVTDKVLYARYAGTEVQLNGNKLLILKESEILGIIEDEIA